MRYTLEQSGRGQILWCVMAGITALCLVPMVRVPRRIDGAVNTISDDDLRIDINTAPAWSLCRLPGIGVYRAETIVTWRRAERQRRRLPDNAPVFERLEDLGRIDGFGPAILRDVGPWIRFNDHNDSASL